VLKQIKLAQEAFTTEDTERQRGEEIRIEEK